MEKISQKIRKIANIQRLASYYTPLVTASENGKKQQTIQCFKKHNARVDDI